MRKGLEAAGIAALAASGAIAMMSMGETGLAALTAAAGIFALAEFTASRPS